MAKRKFVAVADDYGENTFEISSERDGVYQKTCDGHRLRYNEREGRVEQYDEDKGRWDVYIAHIYSANFIAV